MTESEAREIREAIHAATYALDHLRAARSALKDFSRELKDVGGYASIQFDDFCIFADFFWDGLIADAIMQSQIDDAKRQCDEAIRRVLDIRTELEEKVGYNF